VGRGLSGIAEPVRIVAEPTTDDDHRLVAAVRRGDDRAFEALYARYQRRIYAYVMGMVKDHGRAEDVTQEVFVSALRRMRETERPIAFKPWVYEIAKNACIDQFRRSKRAEEISLQADDGFAPADYGRLVGSDPAPDDAVAAKQELDNLCGAFGGLSDTHHEILLLRELEGLSYREIGDRMGMSRPAVESTLFRARRRLTEEYDELVSGARCLRIQSLIATAVESRLGTREQRRLTRHVAYCQPCRREALAAGLDASILTHVPLRKRAAAKLGSLLPFPIFGRWRGGGAGEGGTPASVASSSPPGWMAHAPVLSEQLSGGWGKLAAAAAVLVAGVGAAGVGTKVVGGHETAAAPKRAAAQQGGTQSKGAGGTPTRVRTAGATTKTTASSSRGSQRRGAVRRSARQGNGGNAGSTPASGTPVSTGGGGGGGGTAAGTATGAAGKALPKVKLPAAGGDPTGPVNEVVNQVTEPVQPVVNGVTDTVTDTVGGVTETVDGVTAPVTGTVDDTTDAVEGATGVQLPTLP
jgi:RNA polymerase sigma factor (sigma-70 family)